jgi:hypothetical protein
MGFWSSFSNAITSLEKTLFGDPAETLQKRIDQTNENSKFIGDFRWDGGPDNLKGFKVIYYASLKDPRNENLAVLKSPDDALFLYIERLNCRESQCHSYNSITETESNFTEYSYTIIRRMIDRSSPKKIIETLQACRNVSENKLMELFSELKRIDESHNQQRQTQTETSHDQSNDWGDYQNGKKESAQGNYSGSENGSSQHYKKESQQEKRKPSSSGSMTMYEAREVLNVSKDASVKEIKEAYRILASRLHPDRRGGSTYLMKKLNEAKDILLPD